MNALDTPAARALCALPTANLLAEVFERDHTRRTYRFESGYALVLVALGEINGLPPGAEVLAAGSGYAEERATTLRALLVWTPAVIHGRPLFSGRRVAGGGSEDSSTCLSDVEDLVALVSRPLTPARAGWALRCACVLPAPGPALRARHERGLAS